MMFPVEEEKHEEGVLEIKVDRINRLLNQVVVWLVFIGIVAFAGLLLNWRT